MIAATACASEGYPIALEGDLVASDGALGIECDVLVFGDAPEPLFVGIEKIKTGERFDVALERTGADHLPTGPYTGPRPSPFYEGVPETAPGEGPEEQQ